MTARGLTVRAHPGRLAVVRLPAGAAIPPWASGDADADLATPLHVIARSAGETSIVLADGLVPADVRAERDFRALEVAGPLDFGLTGILAGLTAALAAADVPVFAVSTFDTDWLLVRAPRWDDAQAALRHAGVRVLEAADAD